MQESRAVPVQQVQVGLPFWDDKPLLQKIINFAPNILYVFNQQTKENEFINKSLGASMGYEAAEISAMGADFMPMLCHPEDLPKVHAHFKRLHAMGDGETAHVEYRMKHKDGQWRWMLSHDSVFDRDARGDVLRLVGVATDITARKAAEDAALQQKRAADMANEELRSFAYSVSHDLKAPANTLHLLLSELLTQYDGARDDADIHALFELSLGTIQKMQGLIEDVLDYTRVIGSEAVFDRVPLAPLLADIQQTLAADIKLSGATIIAEELPVVWGNRAQLRAYFQNVISNAIKFRRDGVPVVVTISDVTAPQDMRISIAVSDNGLGIAQKNHARIFGMFKRLHLEEEIAGTGLGLALCHRVAVNHGGRVDLCSAPGKGSTFTLDLARP